MRLCSLQLTFISTLVKNQPKPKEKLVFMEQKSLRNIARSGVWSQGDTVV